jgi:hypothetical protein
MILRRRRRPEERFRVRTVSVAFPVSNDGSRLVPPLSAHSAPIAPGRSMCGLRSYPTREQARIPNDINLLQKGLRLRHAAHTSPTHLDAGWSSPVARQAHNLKVTGSNPVPATRYKAPQVRACGAFACGIGVLPQPRFAVIALKAGRDPHRPSHSASFGKRDRNSGAARR